MSKQNVRVLVVEDDRPVRISLEVSLREEGYEVCACADASGLQRVVEQFRPDLAVLDVRLATGPDGYSTARLLRSQSNLPIIMLTAADTVAERLEGFNSGADDYLIKPFSMAELLARVEALLRRSGRLISAVRQVGDVIIDDAARTVIRAGEKMDLTRTEFDLLGVLAKHPGQVLSKVQLLTQVWGFDAYDVNLVEVHMSSLRKKLEAHGPRLIQTVRGVGYVVRA
ncbi:MAG TPA: response regulator transcription factor [Acidimicrobiales bacterium]|nr:response regulator transcription factor [Acidimicrobiales bacterium]